MGGRFDVGMVAAGRYEIVRFLAAGGMGEVYAARDRVLFSPALRAEPRFVALMQKIGFP